VWTGKCGPDGAREVRGDYRVLLSCREAAKFNIEWKAESRVLTRDSAVYPAKIHLDFDFGKISEDTTIVDYS
jgi:hypothetical protein